MMSQDNGFQKICRVSELKDGFGKRFNIDDVDVAVFKTKEGIFALNNICPHQHAHIIYEGFVEEGRVVCPAHGWEFQLCDGKMAEGRRGLDSYEVKIIENEVFVKVYQKEIDW